MTQLIPAYGRDYTTAKAALADWKSGKDFIIQDISDRYDGKPANCESYPAGTKVMLRYCRKTKIVSATAQKIDLTAKPPRAKPKRRTRRPSVGWDVLAAVEAAMADPTFDGDIVDLIG